MILDLFDKIDSDQSGYIEYTEFITACVNIQSFFNEQNLVSAFKAIDIDGDGHVSLSELKTFFKNSPQLKKFCEGILNKADTDKDNKVYYKPDIARGIHNADSLFN